TGIMDWRDALHRYRHAWPHTLARHYIAALRPGEQLVLAVPIFRTANWTAPWTSLIKRRSLRWEEVLDADPRLVRERAIPHLAHTRPPHGIRIVLYRKLARPR